MLVVMYFQIISVGINSFMKEDVRKYEEDKQSILVEQRSYNDKNICLIHEINQQFFNAIESKR